MTSSSDAMLWQPWASAGDAGRADATAAPEGDWLPALSADGGAAESARRHIEDVAYRRGHEEAVRGERERVEARCANALHAVVRVTEQLEGIVGQFAHDRERDLQAVAIAIARHLVQHELTIDPMRIGELVRRALELLPPEHAFEARLHPEDFEMLGPVLARLQPEGRNVKLNWVADPGIERGGFVLESPQRVVDGRTDVALRALYEKLDHE